MSSIQNQETDNWTYQPREKIDQLDDENKINTYIIRLADRYEIIKIFTTLIQMKSFIMKGLIK